MGIHQSTSLGDLGGGLLFLLSVDPSPILNDFFPACVICRKRDSFFYIQNMDLHGFFSTHISGGETLECSFICLWLGQFFTFHCCPGHSWTSTAAGEMFLNV